MRRAATVRPGVGRALPIELPADVSTYHRRTSALPYPPLKGRATDFVPRPEGV